MDLLIGGRKDLGQSTGGKNLIRSRVVMFADLPGFKVASVGVGVRLFHASVLHVKLH